MPEWAKGVDSRSTSASCVGSNPTAVTLQQPFLGIEPRTSRTRSENHATRPNSQCLPSQSNVCSSGRVSGLGGWAVHAVALSHHAAAFCARRAPSSPMSADELARSDDTSCISCGFLIWVFRKLPSLIQPVSRRGYLPQRIFTESDELWTGQAMHCLPSFSRTLQRILSPLP